jgi:hypothetical protein
MDAGALIAVESGADLARIYVALAARGEIELATSSAVVAQVWRGGARRARLARLLASEVLHEAPLDQEASRRIGAMAAVSRRADVVDGHVALLAGDDGIVLTSDPNDIEGWGIPKARIVAT